MPADDLPSAARPCEGLLLDFPSARQRGRGASTASPAPQQQAGQRAVSPERQDAKGLLEESIKKASQRMAERQRSDDALEQEAQKLRIAMADAGCLIADPSAKTEELLRSLADVEAAVQLYISSAAVQADAANVPVWRRVANSSVPNQPVGDALRPTQGGAADHGNPAQRARSVPPSTSSVRTVGSHLRELTRDPDMLASATASEEASGRKNHQQGLLQAQASCEWTPEAWAEICKADDARRLAQLAVEAEALSEAYRRVAALAEEQTEDLEATEQHVQDIKTNGLEATKNIAIGSKSKVRGLTLKASLGGLVVGGAGGFCVAGPAGAVVGAGASAALGAVGGSTLKRRHRAQVDKLIADADGQATT